MAKKAAEPSYGLPRLTIAEAARVLGIPRAEFHEWLDRVVKPSDQQLSMWTRDRRALSEKLIRLYLVTERAQQSEAHEPARQDDEQPARKRATGHRG